MPIYEYQCKGCGNVFEVLQKHNDPAPESHECGSKELHRVMSSTSFVLKGSGWYVTDYAKKDQAKKGNKGGSEGGSDSGSSSSSSSSDKTSPSGSSSTSAA